MPILRTFCNYTILTMIFFYCYRFNWFLRLDDDVYVNVENLVLFLNSVNSSRTLYIGNAGFGKNADDFIGFEENYCMVRS